MTRISLVLTMMTPWWIVIALWVTFEATPEQVLAAVAANFAPTAEVLAERFREESGCVARVTSASTGTLYAQIRNGAPFDLLLAADTMRPYLLEEEGLAVNGSRFTYAIGRLALWAPGSADPAALLASRDFRYLAIATPSTAPYGAAAHQVLERLGLLETVAPKLVRGQNVTQAFHYIASGNAELGFVSLAHVLDQPSLSIWIVDRQLYDPILQQAVLLQWGAEAPCAAAFLRFLRSNRAVTFIEGRGYGRAERDG